MALLHNISSALISVSYLHIMKEFCGHFCYKRHYYLENKLQVTKQREQ